jgi:hypothetical protein
VTVEQAEQLLVIVICRRLADFHEKPAVLSPHVLNAF